MRRSSKVLVFVFFAVAAGLIYWTTKSDEEEIGAAVEERMAAIRAEYERSMADSLADREKEIEERIAALDSAIARVEAPVIYRIDAGTVEQVLTRMGVAYERSVDDVGDPMFKFKLATYDAYLYFYGCEPEGCTALHLSSAFRLDPPPSTDLMNEWNRTKLYSTAYRNDRDAATLETDLLVSGGITLGAVETYLTNYRDRLGEFTTHINW